MKKNEVFTELVKVLAVTVAGEYAKTRIEKKIRRDRLKTALIMRSNYDLGQYIYADDFTLQEFNERIDTDKKFIDIVVNQPK